MSLSNRLLPKPDGHCRLLVVAIGNITNDALLALFAKHLDEIASARIDRSIACDWSGVRTRVSPDLG
jgi:hypothetical protein